MARMRGIKPEFFQHEGLFDLEAKTGLPVRLVFIGLWTQADREGRFQWRPRQIKTQLDPYGAIDLAAVLDALADGGFVVRYEVDGETYGVIPKFTKHQNIPKREPESKLPEPPPGKDSASTGTGLVLSQASTGTVRVQDKTRPGTGRTETETETETEREREKEIGNGTETESSFGFSGLDSLSEDSDQHDEPDKPPTKHSKRKSGSVFDWLPKKLFDKGTTPETAYVVKTFHDWQQRASQTPPPVIGPGDNDLMFLLAAWSHSRKTGENPCALFRDTVGGRNREWPRDEHYKRAGLMLAAHRRQRDNLSGDPLAATVARIGQGGSNAP